MRHVVSIKKQATKTREQGKEGQTRTIALPLWLASTSVCLPTSDLQTSQRAKQENRHHSGPASLSFFSSPALSVQSSLADPIHSLLPVRALECQPHRHSSPFFVRVLHKRTHVSFVDSVTFVPLIAIDEPTHQN